MLEISGERGGKGQLLKTSLKVENIQCLKKNPQPNEHYNSYATHCKPQSGILGDVKISPLTKQLHFIYFCQTQLIAFVSIQNAQLPLCRRE